jgi:hypothetical protein
MISHCELHGGRRANPATACPAYGAANETLSHFVLECPATSALRDAMLAELRSLPRCAEKLPTDVTPISLPQGVG